jgi:hypothetical protein
MIHQNLVHQNRRIPALRHVLAVISLLSLIGGLGLVRPGLNAAAAAPPCTNRATFVADVTIPDNTAIAPGTTFVKTWRLRNSGTCTWTTGYASVFSSGSRMGAASPVPLSTLVSPGNTIDISVPMVAPTAPGTYRGNWLLRSDTGASFGLGSSGTTPFYVQIRVQTTPPTPAPAQRITFPAGATSTSVSVQLASGVPKAFVLRAGAGQVMTISMASPITSITVLAPTGLAMRPVSQGSATIGPWTYQLPTTGDYRITVIGSGPNVMLVSIPPAGATPTPTPAAPQRITFASGATSASVSMQLVAGQPKVFVIRAGAGQVMTLYFDAPVNYVEVRAPGGLVLAPNYSDGSTVWQFYLPRTGDNTIVVTGSGPRWMTVEIPPA